MSGLGAAPHETNSPHRTTMSSYDTNSHVGDTRERDYDPEVAAALRQKIQELQEERERLQEKLNKAQKEIERLRNAIRRVRGYNADIRDGKINYRPQNHIDVLDNALDGGGDTDA